MSTQHFPRDARGRAIVRKCADPNCDGHLAPAGEGTWRCNGLTHKGDTDPLEPCARCHVDGEDPQPTQ